ncbi:hypothetical protein OAV88_03515 [bacterium]|nr:hypothetical protein [bacterium]
MKVFITLFHVLVVITTTTSKIIELTSNNFDDVLKSNDFTFVIFHADPSISWHYFKEQDKHLDVLDSLISKREKKTYGIALATANVKKYQKLSIYSKMETLHAMVFSNDPVNFPPVTYRGPFVGLYMYNFVDSLVDKVEASYEVGMDPFVRDAVNEFVKARFGGDINDQNETEKRSESVKEIRDRFDTKVDEILETEDTVNQHRVLALKAMKNALRDVAYNSASLALNVNKIRHRLSSEADTLTFEQTLELTSSLKVWQFLADAVMRGGEAEHETVHSKIIGSTNVDLNNADRKIVMEVKPRMAVLE